jgi:hypothetical protein
LVAHPLSRLKKYHPVRESEALFCLPRNQSSDRVGPYIFEPVKSTCDHRTCLQRISHGNAGKRNCLMPDQGWPKVFLNVDLIGFFGKNTNFVLGPSCLGIGIDWSFGPYTISCLERRLAASLYNFRLLPLSVQVNRTTNFKQSATSFGIRRRLARGTQLRTVASQGLAPRSFPARLFAS